MGGGSVKDKPKYEQMIKFLSTAETKEVMNNLAMLFILDRSFDRGDIAEAIHDVEVAKGWHT